MQKVKEQSKRLTDTKQYIKVHNKKALDITTKGWSDEDLKLLEEKINDQNFRWIAKGINDVGEIKWFHAYTKVDVEIFVLQEGYKILNVVSRK